MRLELKMPLLACHGFRHDIRRHVNFPLFTRVDFCLIPLATHRTYSNPTLLQEPCGWSPLPIKNCGAARIAQTLKLASPALIQFRLAEVPAADSGNHIGSESSINDPRPPVPALLIG